MFKKPTDHKDIDTVTKDKNTECVLIEYKNPEANRSKVLGCVVFQTFDNLPFAAFFSYVALQNKFKSASLDKTMISKNHLSNCFDNSLDGDC